MTAISIIHNPRSGSGRLSSAQVRALAHRWDVTQIAEPDNFDALLGSLDEFSRHGTEVVAIIGGDGTVREVVTALAALGQDQTPALAIIAGGKTNLIARDVGGATSGSSGLERVLKAAASGALTKRPVWRNALDITRADRPDRPIRGFFFGAGAFTHGTELAQTRLHANGVRHGLAVGLAIAALVYRCLRGARIGAEPGTGDMALAADGGPLEDGDRLIVLATTLARIMLGLGLFWGPDGAPIRYTQIDGAARRLAAAVVPVLRGRPKPWMAVQGYRSARAQNLVLQLHSRFVVDGEIFDPGASGRVSLAASPPLAFVSP